VVILLRDTISEKRGEQWHLSKYTSSSDEKNQIFVSLVSIWEITIKNQIGKLSLRDDVATIFKQQEEKNSFKLLKIELPHVFKVGELPLHHRDPFDRLLIAQAIVEDFTLLSKDKNFSAYPVTVLW
jgi:PIN domain nuclease of toxin-antitoxin system